MHEMDLREILVALLFIFIFRAINNFSTGFYHRYFFFVLVRIFPLSVLAQFIVCVFVVNLGWK